MIGPRALTERLLSVAGADEERGHPGPPARLDVGGLVADETPIERLFALARDAGASGGKICGAGGSGYVLLACASERQAGVRDALEREGGQFASFAFVPEGVRATRDGEPWAPLPG